MVRVATMVTMVVNLSWPVMRRIARGSRPLHPGHSTKEVLQKILLIVHINIYIDVCLGIPHLVIDHREDGLWRLASSLNFQECVLMMLAFLAGLTVVKVLADAAFVADADDRVHATAITPNVGVLLHWVHGLV